MFSAKYCLSGPCLIFSLYFRKTDFKKQNVEGTLIQKAEMTKMKWNGKKG